MVDESGEVVERTFYTPDGERVVVHPGLVDEATGIRGPPDLCVDALGDPCPASPRPLATSLARGGGLEGCRTV